MNYKRMWERLKKEIELKREGHIRGDMQSMAESFQGEANCDEILKMMKDIEVSEGIE